jgi:ribonuclease J
MNDVTHPSRRTLAANAVNPSSEQVLYVPLGGTGEIGMNLNLYGHAGSWLMVDCGMMMDRDHGGLDVLVPDPEFINAHRDSLEAIVLTHAHMDHIGALAWIWPQLQCPIIATRFTAAMVARELANRLPEPVLENLALRIVNPGDTIEIGPFAVEWLTLTHSIPEPCALVIKTTVGTVFHTGDWKLDPAPVVGDNYDEQRIREVGREGVSALIGDSTNATVPGVSGSESSLREPLTQLAREATGRVVVTCFASNVARLFTLARVAADSGRRLCLLGAGLEKTAGLARSTGYWDDDIALVPARHVAYLPREEVLAVATGSQGESSAALARLALGTHRDLDLDAYSPPARFPATNRPLA